MALDDELQLKPKEAADLAAEYKTICEALSATERRRDMLKAQLKEYIQRTGEPLCVEGLPPLKLQPRSGSTTWDVKAMAENDEATFTRLLELGCLTVNTKLAAEQEAAGNVTSFRQYGHAGQTEPALVWERER